MFLTKTKVFEQITKRGFNKNKVIRANHQACFWQKQKFLYKSPSMFLAKTKVFVRITKHVFSKNKSFQANHQTCFWQKLQFSSKSPSMFLAKYRAKLQTSLCETTNPYFYWKLVFDVLSLCFLRSSFFETNFNIRNYCCPVKCIFLFVN